MLHHEQFLSEITSANNRPIQQSSSPSDNSMSTATPPHQISRASPASTALVMSSNNIASGSSRQLTPSNGSSSTGGGGNSSGHTSDSSTNHHTSAANPTNAPPNPMMRQFTCHTKSVSAGVGVSVPGITNNLATAMGMNQNNVINNTIAANQHQMQQRQMNHHQTGATNNMQVVNNGKQHVNREHRSSHHHRSISSHQQQIHHQQQQQHAQQQQQQQHQQQQYHHQQQQNQQTQLHHNHQEAMNQQQQQQHHHHNIINNNNNIHNNNNNTNHNSINGSSQNFIDARQSNGSSSILLSSNSIHNVHNRSASTHLSNMLLTSHQQHANNNNHHPQATLRQIDLNAHHYPQQVTNSIWSIDENISKSHGKLLTASGYLTQTHHPFDPSITGLSCDNVSTASRLLANADTDGPAPSYYLHQNHHSTNSAHPLANNMVSTSGPPNHASLSVSRTTLKQAEFLPICDLMFNLISMIVYFCENVFGIIALIALYYHASSKYWSLIGAAFVFASNFICQYLSLRWLYKTKLEDCRRKREAQEELEDEEECERRYRMAANMRQYQCGSCTWLPDGATEVQLKFLLSIALDAILHIFCLGFLVRYIKLVIPISDTTRVKREARDLCMLRMIHGFIQSAPLLLLQSYMACSQTYTSAIFNLSITSVILSLITVCWALASFTKYARKKYMHKFVLTWLGILSQFLWRLGTISSRVAALTIYAVYYGYWMLVVLALHWITMFLWLIKPGNLLRDEVNLSKSKKLSVAVSAAWVYCFCYMNFEEHNSRAKMGIFYLIMFLENNLLFTVCQTISSTQVTWFKTLSILVVYLGFVFGMLFMLLYYKYFHVTVLNNGNSCSQDSINSIADQLSPAGKKIAGFKPGTLRLRNDDGLGVGSGARSKYTDNISATLQTGSHPEIARSSKPPYLSSNHHMQLPQSGVFNCRLNTSLKKQKIPSSHIHR